MCIRDSPSASLLGEFEQCGLQPQKLIASGIPVRQQFYQRCLLYTSSSIKDRHGVFAFISKDERRDLPLRKQRPSGRAQLKEGQSKKAAAPKKAAAKAKDNDLEV